MNRRTFVAGTATLAPMSAAAQFFPFPSTQKWAVIFGTWCGTARDAAMWISEGMGGIAAVFDAVRQAIIDAGRGGGFILAPDHSHPDISVERLRWMVEAAREYGTYPLRL